MKKLSFQVKLAFNSLMTQQIILYQINLVLC